MPADLAMPTVYVIDDDAEARDGLCFHLHDAGLTVKAYDRAEAFLADYTPELTGCLITDVRLPGMDGVHLIESLIRKGTRLPVIVVSGFAQTPLVVEAMRLAPSISLRSQSTRMRCCKPCPSPCAEPPPAPACKARRPPRHCAWGRCLRVNIRCSMVSPEDFQPNRLPIT